MKLDIRHFVLLFFLLLSMYIVVLLLKEMGIWNTVVSVLQILIQILYGLLLALVLEVWIHRVPSKKRVVQVLSVYICLALVVVLLLWYGIPKLILYAQQFSLVLPNVIDIVTKWIPNNVQEYIPMVSNVVMEYSHSVMDGFQSIGFIVTSALFISLDLPTFSRNIVIDSNFIQTADTIIFQYTKGIGLDLCILYIVFGCILFIFQFPEGWLVAGILALFNLFPIFGPMLGFGLLILLSFMVYGYFPLVLLISIFVMQQVESNWIQPFIFKKVMHLQPIVTLISLFICGSIFGIFGMLFSPIIAGIVQLVFRSFLFSKRTKSVGSWEDVWYNFED